MPWKETVIMNEKLKFITSYLDLGEETFSSLCERFSISCKTGYKYVTRYKEEGLDGLKERSRAPHSVNRIPTLKEEAILEVKHRHIYWGAKKILNWLKQEHPEGDWPAKSTIDELLKRHHLVRPTKRKRMLAPYTEPFILCQQPNDSWSIDYKGQFMLGNQQLCYPLTITDNYSRYLLAVDAFSKICGQRTKKILLCLFSEFGLPLAMRSDNGPPFASNGLAGLSRLSVWLIKLGIVPERIRPGSPQENGRHERMHRTLKQETTLPPKEDMIEQQRHFDTFKRTFNEERPHEGIGFNRPCWLHQSSTRFLPTKSLSIEYDESVLMTRRIRTNGTMKWRGNEIFISETLTRETIGFKPYNEHEWLIYFSFMPIGIFDEKTCKVRKIR